MGVLVLLGPTPGEALCRTYSTFTTVGRLNDPAITEISGVVASRTHPGIYWVHNDSGDGPRVFAFYIRCGTPFSLGSYTVSGIPAGRTLDWEDLSLGVGPDGRDWLYVGDFGNNGFTRNKSAGSALRLIRFPEPALDLPLIDPATVPGSRGNTESGRTEVLPFLYPDHAVSPTDGNYDTESLGVHPTNGSLYLLTKRVGNTPVPRMFRLSLSDSRWINASIFNWDAPIKATAQLLSDPVGITGTPTAMDISPDGERVVARDYSQVYVYTRAAGESFEQSWTNTPQRFSGIAGQDEAICFTADGEYLLSAPEGTSPPVVISNCSQAPFIRGITTQDLGANGYQIAFQTQNQSGTALVASSGIDWGDTLSLNTFQTIADSATTHSVTLTPLLQGTRYLYRIRTEKSDTGGNLLSDQYECAFTPSQSTPGDLTPPSPPGGLQLSFE